MQGMLTAGSSLQPPGIGTVVLAPAQSRAQVAADDGEADAAEDADAEDADAEDAARYLAERPTAYWITPEQDPPGTAGETVAALAEQAREQQVSLAVVIYGLPARDCGSHSAGGLSEKAYPRWVDEIADALAAVPQLQKIVILEPDSLALAPSCGNIEQRTRQLKKAVKSLTAPGTWIYLDGGHSNWLPVGEMAQLIRAVDAAGQVRGFATNVSNYNSTRDEFAYAHALAKRLDDDMHAVVDTSRNGGLIERGLWCNPPGARVGDAGGSLGDGVIDVNLWIKPPGESDGPCHGGPVAGVWWPEGAVALTDGIR